MNTEREWGIWLGPTPCWHEKRVINFFGGGGSHRFVLSVEVAFYHPGGVGAAVRCSGVQYSTQPSSRSLQRFPKKYEGHGHTWLQSLHLFLIVPYSGKKNEEFKIYVAHFFVLLLWGLIWGRCNFSIFCGKVENSAVSPCTSMIRV